MTAYSGKGEAAHIDGIESSEESAAVVGCTRNAEFVRNGDSRHFERLHRVVMVESFERPQHRHVTELG